MTGRNDFNGVIADWLDEQAGRGTPDYLDEVLVRTTRTRQRPAWSSLERWLPVQTTFSGRLMPIPRLAWAVGVLAILILAIVALFAAGVGQRRLPHFGAAANGQIAFVDGGNLEVAAADGTRARTLMALPEGAEQLTFSPDGTRLAYRSTGSVPSIVVTNADGSNPVVVASGASLGTGEPLAWSPDSRRIAFTDVIVADTIGTIDIVDADGSHRTQVIQGPAAVDLDRYRPAWSPDGQWISFFFDREGRLRCPERDPSGRPRRATPSDVPDESRHHGRQLVAGSRPEPHRLCLRWLREDVRPRDVQGINGRDRLLADVVTRRATDRMVGRPFPGRARRGPVDR
jgi:hypothetical protein